MYHLRVDISLHPILKSPSVVNFLRSLFPLIEAREVLHCLELSGIVLRNDYRLTSVLSNCSNVPNRMHFKMV